MQSLVPARVLEKRHHHKTGGSFFIGGGKLGIADCVADMDLAFVQGGWKFCLGPGTSQVLVQAGERPEPNSALVR
jgi:hypothetical protein